jgi:hypothetical protein
MYFDADQKTAELALLSLNELSMIGAHAVLPNLRLLRDAIGRVQDNDRIERADAWWAICLLCEMISTNPSNPGLPIQWQRALGLTSKWVAIFTDRVDLKTDEDIGVG